MDVFTLFHLHEYYHLGLLVCGVHADGSQHRTRNKRIRGSPQLSRGGRAFRQGRQDVNGLDPAAPVSSYGAANTSPPPPLGNVPIDEYVADAYVATEDQNYESPGASLDPISPFAPVAPAFPLEQYSSIGDDNGPSQYEEAIGKDALAGSGDSNLAMLEKAVPGVPGKDYPIYASVPETAFTCEGQIEGGYYADPAVQCQAFHICTADGFGGLAKYSFLCPNGTTFNQNYFICDWWFNFDCAEAEALYSRNAEIRAEQEANIEAVGAGNSGSVDTDNTEGGFDDSIAYDNYDLGVTESALTSYGITNTEAMLVFQDNGLLPALGSYGSPGSASVTEKEEKRGARKFPDNQSRSRSGRRFNGQRRNKQSQSSRREGRQGRRLSG
ncbi:hypothetical protein TCAL_06644 [Tigriopus californicus]|uniref:Chitin-binding type-2 domain-containing protein n=2 Tax=Tigriopus californicus TaxID=6832 RepID=A0A553NXJ3_TIGCA|nr:hypothetical protein TCAL_06644 [Tigriopus californicus]